MDTIGKSALLLIECQNEWLSPQGKLYRLMEDRPQFATSISNITQALQAARQSGITIVHSGLRFQPGYPELAGGYAGLRKVIPRAGTFPADGPGSQFFPDHAPAEGEFLVAGRLGASAFTGSNLDPYLRHHHIEHLYIAGYAMHVCVESTLRDAHERGYHPILLSDASAAFTAQQKEYVLQHVVHHFGSHLTTAQFIQSLQIKQS